MKDLKPMMHSLRWFFVLLAIAGSACGFTIVDVQREAGQQSDATYVACGSRISSGRIRRHIAGDNPVSSRWSDVSLSDSLREGRVYKGENASYADYPFMAAITENDAFRCNAFVIHPRWLLTHSKCFELIGVNFNPSLTGYVAHTGSENFTAADKTKLTAFIGFPSAATLFITPGQKKPEIGAWGLFFAESNLTAYGSRTLPICLAKDSKTDDLDNLESNFLGWGSPEKKGNNRRGYTELLRRAAMKILTRSTCNWKYYWNLKFSFNSGNARKFYTSRLAFCAKASGGAVAGPCKFDQGGPMFIDLKNATTNAATKWAAFAVFHDLGRDDEKCAVGTAPPIFTNLDYFVDSIVNIVRTVGAADQIANAVPAIIEGAVAAVGKALADAIAALAG